MNVPNVRVIARLDIKGPNLVKGVHFEGLRVLGKPEWFARYYYENGVDELIYMDVVASLFGRNSLLDVVERTARQIFIPLTVGGGLRTIDDIKEALRSGADKVSLNTAALARPELIREASRRFGASTIVVSIEALSPDRDGRYEAYANYGRERTQVDALTWAERAVELGAGELMVTSIDREGTGKGFDLELVRQIAARVSVPIIASGGAGSLDDVRRVVSEGHADAVAIASMFHYDCLQNGAPTEADDAVEGNTEFLRRKTGVVSRRGASPWEVKAHLSAHGVDCRVQTTHASI